MPLGVGARRRKALESLRGTIRHSARSEKLVITVFRSRLRADNAEEFYELAAKLMVST